MRRIFYLIAWLCALPAFAQVTATVNNVINPLSYGVPSGGSATSTTASTTAGSISVILSSVADFKQYQDIFIGHAGAACGAVRGAACPNGPSATATTAGTPGTTTYTYNLACLDGLGAEGIAGTTASLSTGNATLNTTNYNIVQWTSLAGCIEIAIYRNGSLIATQYENPTGISETFDDQGISSVSSNRDISLTPPSQATNDNLVAQITSVSGSTIMVSSPAGATLTGTLALHSDVPLLQAAISAGFSGVVDVPPGVYLVNYPLNLNRTTGTFRGGGQLVLATNDIGLDLTGAYSLNIENLVLTGSKDYSESSTAFFCSRDTTMPGGTAQNNNFANLYIANYGYSAFANGGEGEFGSYNYGCEIQELRNITINGTGTSYRFTGNNVEELQSPFDSNEAETFVSMSAITILNPTGGTPGRIFDFDSTYNITIVGGYSNGGDNPSVPYAAYFEGNSGNISIQNHRVEEKGGGLYLAAGASLNASNIQMPVYRNSYDQSYTPVPQVYIGTESSGFTALQYDRLWIDDYGGSPAVTEFLGGPNACSAGWNNIFVGVNERYTPCTAVNQTNLIYQVNGNLYSGDFLTGQITASQQSSDGQLFVANPASTGNASIVYIPGWIGGTSSFNGPGYVYRMGVGACGDALSDFELYNYSSGCSLSYLPGVGLTVTGSVTATAISGGTVSAGNGFSGTKSAGSCTFTIVNGIITNVTGC